MEIFPKDIQYIIAGYLKNFDDRLDINLIINLYTSRSNDRDLGNSITLDYHNTARRYCGLFYPRLAESIILSGVLWFGDILSQARAYKNCTLVEYILYTKDIEDWLYTRSMCRFISYYESCMYLYELLGINFPKKLLHHIQVKDTHLIEYKYNYF